MDIVDSTRSFERWLGKHLRLRRDDLRYKHRLMAADTFSFLRATFYRWAQLWPEALPELAQAPRVLAVGDLHVENYGTWRDAEGRLVWGMNDFDEAARLPFTADLVRLATSAGLAAAEGHLNIDLKQACSSILAGYSASIRAGGKPMVLAEKDRWLRKMATGRLRDPIVFCPRSMRFRPPAASRARAPRPCSCGSFQTVQAGFAWCGADPASAALAANASSPSPNGMGRPSPTKRRRSLRRRGNGHMRTMHQGGSSIWT